MAVPTVEMPEQPDDPTALDEVSLRALEIYEQTLKQRLERDHNGWAAAIDVGSEGYSLGRTTGEALRAMQRISPNGELVVMKVGPEPEYGLAARMMAAQMRAKRGK